MAPYQPPATQGGHRGRSVVVQDGPAKGTSLVLRRAPAILRVVIDPDGAVDALDQLDDRPEDTEQITAYQLTAKPAGAFVCIRGKNRRNSGYRVIAKYRVCDDQPGSEAEHQDTWEQWARAYFESHREQFPWI